MKLFFYGSLMWVTGGVILIACCANWVCKWKQKCIELRKQIEMLGSLWGIAIIIDVCLNSALRNQIVSNSIFHNDLFVNYWTKVEASSINWSNSMLERFSIMFFESETFRRNNKRRSKSDTFKFSEQIFFLTKKI